MRRARAAAQLLRAVFPSVGQLRIELSFKDASSCTPAAQAHVLYPPAPAFFTYRCPYSDCDGEFDLQSAVGRAMSAGDPHEVGSLACRGSRPGEGGVRRSCDLLLEYAITAVRDEAC
ncbi:MAG TPA: hypothetical protein VME21_01295 [Steroidobacteraceae bacterium]|nr:hypothetical protein [Steroidobacteraceae bacterium]